MAEFYILTDDTAFTPGTSDVGVVGMIVDETAPDSLDEGDAGAPRMTADRKQLTVLVDATTDSQRLAIGSSGQASVAVVDALPAGTNNIGDVDVLSVIPGTGATNLGKAVDSAAGATDTGVALLAVRDDALTTLTPVDGDYTHLRVNSTGALHVTGSLGGNDSVIVDDTAFTPATSSVAAAGFFADETAPDSVNEGDIGAARMTLDRKQLMVLVDATTDSQRLAIGTSGQASVAVVDALPAGTNNIGDVDVLTVPAPLSTTGGGTEATALRVTIANDSTGVLSIDDNSGSLTIDQATHDNLNANANIQVADVDVSATNPVPVQIVSGAVSANEIHDYDEATSVAGAGTDNHDYTASGGVFLLKKISFSAEGGASVEVINDATGAPATVWKGYIPRGQGGLITHEFANPVEVADADVLRLTRTNRQAGTQDLNSTIEGNQL